MSVRGALHRSDRTLSDEEAASFLKQATEMRLGTTDTEGWPYVVPLSFDYRDGKVFFHHTSEDSHLTSCLGAGSRVCIEADEAGPVLSIGETACDTSRVFTSVIAFGKVNQVTDKAAKERVFDDLVAKYYGPGSALSGSYPKFDTTLVFQVDIDVITGKRRPQP